MDIGIGEQWYWSGLISLRNARVMALDLCQKLYFWSISAKSGISIKFCICFDMYMMYVLHFVYFQLGYSP